MILTNEQNTALKEIKDWYTRESLEFKLAGLAGTGKSSLIPFIAEELNLNLNVQFLAPTNKAMLVLRNKLPQHHRMFTSTIHNFLYSLQHLSGCGDCYVQNASACHGYLGYNRCGCLLDFVLDEWTDPQNVKFGYDLMIVDEASMVSGKVHQDIIRTCKLFNIKVLFVGDHGQLAPVETNPENLRKYGNFFLMRQPDFTLNEIQRQAKDSPIIKLAYEARGRWIIPFGAYGEGVAKYKKSDEIPIDPTVDTVGITYFINERKDDEFTVSQLNNLWRANFGVANMPGPYEAVAAPIVGDKVICLQNVRDKLVGIVAPKGIRGTINNIQAGYTSVGKGFYDAEIFLEDGTVHCAKMSADQFNSSKPLRERTRFERWTFGYALTGHQAQGSEFDDVIVFEPHSNFRDSIGTEEYAKWLYTSITRAKKKLTLIQSSERR